jgi:CelD/BcsL family acetyltransferase involved in cellulose biosynthesis
MSVIAACDIENQIVRDVHLRDEIRIIENFDVFKAMRREWDELAAAAEECPLCATYQYCELAAAVVLAKGGLIAVAMVYDDRDLLAIWPVALHRKGPLRIAKALTCGNGEEYGGPLIKGAASRTVARKALAAVMQVPADLLEVSLVQEGSMLHELLESAPQSWLLRLLTKRFGGLTGYSIRLREFPKWDDFAVRLPQSLRSNLRRLLRQLSAKGHTEIGWCTTVDDADAVLTWLFANKRRWAQARGLNPKYLMDDQVRDFFTALARHIDMSTIPLVAFVKVNDVPVAASVNLVGSRSVEGFITTYDEAFGRYSVGNLLVEFVVTWSHANGRDFDFRPLFADNKARWANRETRHKTLFVFLSVRGRLMEIALLARGLARRGKRVAKGIVLFIENAKARFSLPDIRKLVTRSLPVDADRRF